MARQARNWLGQLPLPPSNRLAEALYAAPALLAILSRRHRKTLSQCCKQLRNVIHSSVTTVAVEQNSDVRAVLKGYWPQLCLIKVHATLCSYDVQPARLAQNSNFQLTASLVFTESQHSDSSTALIVCPDTQTNQHQRIAAAFNHLRGPEWCRYSHVTLTAHSQAASVIAQLAQSDWPHLRVLKVTNTALSLASVKQLAAGSWLRLRSLDFTNNQLDVAAMTALIQGQWPMLTRLVLDSNATSSTVPAALIPNSAIWTSLSNLSLMRMKLNASCVHSISLLHNQLEQLNLTDTFIGAAALSQLASSPWPQLQHLTLASNRLGADATASLALAQMPNLKTLNLEQNELNAASASCLVKGRWLKLSSVALDSNEFDDVAMAFLAKGQWPLLQTLCLPGNNVSILGYELLMAGQWPQLSSLILDDSAVCAASWKLLNLTGHAMPAHDREPYFIAPRKAAGVSLNRRAVWPKLAQVEFVSCRPKLAEVQFVSHALKANAEPEAKAFKAKVEAVQADIKA